MSIFIVSDTHGENDHHKLNNDFVYKSCSNSYPDYVIVTGDFGFLWSNIPDNIEAYWLNWLEQKQFKILFIDGNHENFNRINNLSSVNMFNSVVGQVSDRIFHLKRGHIYTIDNKTFFCLGGASSIDKNSRIEGVSWWYEEVPTYADYHLALDNLAKVGYKVDYVLTHTCPKHIKSKLFSSFNSHYKLDFNDSTENMLDSIDERISYKKWLHGHMHLDKSLVIDNKQYTCMYEKGAIV